MLSTRICRCLAIAFTGITADACTSAKDASGEGSQSARVSSGSESTVETSKRDPCALITRAEAEAILSDVFTVRPGSEASSCEYVPAQGNRLNGFTMTVHWKNGKEALSVVKSAMTIATDLTKGGEADLSSMMSLEPIEGLGDEAYFNPMAGSTVLKDDTLLEFDIRTMMWHRKREEGKEAWKQLVAKALARL